MTPDPAFVGLDKSFWALVKLVSERTGYSTRRKPRRKKSSGLPVGEEKRQAASLKTYSLEDLKGCLAQAELKTDRVLDGSSAKLTTLGEKVVAYLNRRGKLLVDFAEPNLMNREQAKGEFEALCARFSQRKCVLPMNKRKGEQRHHAYMAGIINMLTENTLGDREFCGDPRGLTVVTRDGYPVRTLSRRMDGAFPKVVDPTAVWEVKEYYGTTSFGSRVADGVYETMLDGYELLDLAEHEGIRILHYLIVDDRLTWWEMGRSYLCRIVDMVHAGFVDEVLFGREVLTRWPAIVRAWQDPKIGYPSSECVPSP